MHSNRSSTQGELDTVAFGNASIDRPRRNRTKPPKYNEEHVIGLDHDDEKSIESEHSQDVDFDVRRPRRIRSKRSTVRRMSENVDYREVSDEEVVSNGRRGRSRATFRAKALKLVVKTPTRAHEEGVENSATHYDPAQSPYMLRSATKREQNPVEQENDSESHGPQEPQVTRSGRKIRPTERFTYENGGDPVPLALEPKANRRDTTSNSFSEQSHEPPRRNHVARKRRRNVHDRFDAKEDVSIHSLDLVEDLPIDSIEYEEYEKDDVKVDSSPDKGVEDEELPPSPVTPQRNNERAIRYELRERKGRNEGDHNTYRNSKRTLKRKAKSTAARRINTRRNRSRSPARKRPRRARYNSEILQKSHSEGEGIKSLSKSSSSSSEPSDSSSQSSLPDLPLNRSPVPNVRSRGNRGWRKRTRAANLAADTLMSRARGTRAKQSGIEPLKIDLSLTWDDVGGLDHHIRTLKEMVFLPLLYPEVFERFKMEAPKGVLFYGPPGTGKTLCARALAASCGAAPDPPSKSGTSDGQDEVIDSGKPDSAERQREGGNKKPRVSFFMRNGADCLSKWVGEAERHLRMTFEAAKAHQPSIIFFDEIDGLAPVRSARQDQIHSSIVSTLLGLMDGLDSRGRIVVIGATNRVDAIDPALRRPGRFDRELIFTLPNVSARRRILDIHTAAWEPPPDKKVLDVVAERAVGYCGADLRALCAEAALRALRRRYPQIYESSLKYVINVNEVNVSTRDFIAAMKDVVPASHRAAKINARPIPVRLRPLLQSEHEACLRVLKNVFPQGMSSMEVGNENEEDVSDQETADHGATDQNGSLHLTGIENAGLYRGGTLRASDDLILRPRLLVCGRASMGQDILGAALLHSLESCPVHSIDLAHIYSSVTARSPEEALMTNIREACRSVPSVLYLPHLELWWSEAPTSLKTTLRIALRDIPANLPVLILATADVALDELDPEIASWFADVSEVEAPEESARKAYFARLVQEAIECPTITDAILSKRRALRRNEKLEIASVPTEKQISEQTSSKKKENERYLRILRMEMRKFVDQLIRDRRFSPFRDPVNLEDAPDYNDIISSPMDLKTVAIKLDDGAYPTVISFIADIDLIVQNAIKYNPKDNPTGFLVLRSAHGLIDHVYAWVDKLNPVVVERCNTIVSERISTLTEKKNSPSIEVAPEVRKALDGPNTNATNKPVLNDRVRDVDMGRNGDVLPRGSALLQESTSLLPNGHMNGTATDVQTEGRMEVEGMVHGNVVANGVSAEEIKPSLAFSETVDGEEGIQEKGGIPEEPRHAAVSEVIPCVNENGTAMSDTEPFIPAPSKTILALKELLIRSTEKLSIDTLESIYTKCATVLRKYQRSKDRKRVVEELLEAMKACL